MLTRIPKPRLPDAVSRILLARGEAALAPLGMGFLALLAVALLACGYLLTQAHQQQAHQRQLEDIQSIATLLAEAASHMLADGRLSPVRRMVMDLDAHPHVHNARITLPGGQILAHAQPVQTNTDHAAADWYDSTAALTPTWHQHAAYQTLSQPIRVAQHGTAILELDVPHPQPDALAAAQPVGIAASASLALLLLLYRAGRRRLRAVSRVQEALDALAEGEPSTEALLIDHTLGHHAATWNGLLRERQQLQRELHLHAQPHETSTDAPASDLARGCDVMPQGIILVDDDERITFANHAAALLFSVERHQLTSSTLAQLIDDPELRNTIRQTCRGQQHRHLCHELERRGDDDRTIGVMRIAIHPIRHEQHNAAMLFIEDMTQQRVAESSLHEFIAQATHELRAPLTNMRLYIEDAQDRGRDDPSVQTQAINILNQETFRLERLVEDMLSVSQIEAGAIHMRHDDVHLDILLTEVVEDYQAQACEKHIALNLDLPPKWPVIHGDRDRLMVVIQNLLSNAIKYTPDQGSVNINAEITATQMRITFQDTGFGISADEQQRIFEKFYRANDQRISSITGTGLGLALAQEIVRLHGGDIELESEPDRGSSFTVCLPIQHTPAATEA